MVGLSKNVISTTNWPYKKGDLKNFFLISKIFPLKINKNMIFRSYLQWAESAGAPTAPAEIFWSVMQNYSRINISKIWMGDFSYNGENAHFSILFSLSDQIMTFSPIFMKIHTCMYITVLMRSIISKINFCHKGVLLSAIFWVSATFSNFFYYYLY